MIATLEKHGLKPPRLERNPAATASHKYFRLLSERYLQGLLTPFVRSGCSVVALDPVGWNGRRQPLCESCSDPIGRRVIG